MGSLEIIWPFAFSTPSQYFQLSTHPGRTLLTSNNDRAGVIPSTMQAPLRGEECSTYVARAIGNNWRGGILVGLWFLVLRHDIPSSVTTIGGCAFEACTLLKRGQSSIEPSSIGKGGRQTDIIVFLRSAPDIPIICHRCRVKPHIRFMFALEQCPITCVGRAGGGGAMSRNTNSKQRSMANVVRVLTMYRGGSKITIFTSDYQS